MRIESNSNVSFDLIIDRVVKGDRNLQTLHISHDWQRGGFHSDQSTQTIPARFYGLWFLARTASSSWDVLPVTRDGFMFSLFLPAAQTLIPAYQYSLDASPTDALTYEIGAAFESAPRSAEEMLLPRSIAGPAAQTVLNRWSSSASVALRASAVAGMLSRNQDGSLENLQELWPKIKDDPSRNVVIAELRNTFRDSKPISVVRLIEIAGAGSSSPELRAAAIRAITAMHTKESLGFVASLLESPDTEERMRGVFALSSFVNGCPAQTPETGDEFLQCKNPSPYRTQQTMAEFAFRRGPEDQETQIVSFWSNWWNENKSVVASKN